MTWHLQSISTFLCCCMKCCHTGGAILTGERWLYVATQVENLKDLKLLWKEGRPFAVRLMLTCCPTNNEMPHLKFLLRRTQRGFPPTKSSLSPIPPIITMWCDSKEDHGGPSDSLLEETKLNLYRRGGSKRIRKPISPLILGGSRESITIAQPVNQTTHRHRGKRRGDSTHNQRRTDIQN